MAPRLHPALRCFLWLLVGVCINPGDNGALAPLPCPRPAPCWLCVVAAGPLCRETQLRCPGLAWAGPKEEVGHPGAGGGQLPPALFKGQRFSTAGEGQVGGSGQPCPLEHTLPRGGGGPDQRLCAPPLQPSTGGTRGAFVPLEKRGRLLPRPALPEQSSRAGEQPCGARAGPAFLPTLSKYSVLH